MKPATQDDMDTVVLWLCILTGALCGMFWGMLTLNRVLDAMLVDMEYLAAKVSLLRRDVRRAIPVDPSDSAPDATATATTGTGSGTTTTTGTAADITAADVSDNHARPAAVKGAAKA